MDRQIEIDPAATLNLRKNDEGLVAVSDGFPTLS
jgi:hypothetical protein